MQGLRHFNVDTSTWNVLSVCSGVGGFDLGVRLAVPNARTVCYVEREAFAVAVLVARMQDKCLDDAPVWTDIKTFDGKPWHRKVDCIIGGYPCQPFSIAGNMRGEDDPRHLWPDIRRIIGEIQPDWCFFENVENHVKIGFENVRKDLLDCGFDVEAGIFTAAEVGAPHGRARLFILARNMVNPSCSQPFWSAGDSIESKWKSTTGFSERCERLAFPPSKRDFRGWEQAIKKDKSIKPTILRMVDGMDARLDSSIYAYRQERLRAVGNGVVPLTAAFAFQTLMRKFL